MSAPDADAQPAGEDGAAFMPCITVAVDAQEARASAVAERRRVLLIMLLS
jgi:hypothetical protein